MKFKLCLKRLRVVEYDEKSLSEAILEILSNNDLKKKLGKEGRELIKYNYSSEIVGEKIENLYLNSKIRGEIILN
jgi:glycosyltransferase involved in cell wall biosynthesis